MCFVCRTIGLRPETRLWHDVVLAKRADFAVAIPGIGAVTPGYVQICPTRHVASLTEMTMNEVPAFLDLVDHVYGVLSRHFGSIVVFEHGGRSAQGRSACVDHAHLHMWACGLTGALSVPSIAAKFDTLGGFLRTAAAPSESPYVMYIADSGECIVGDDPGISQYFRRQIAAALGKPDEWDYAAFPHYANVQVTIDAFATPSRPPVG